MSAEDVVILNIHNITEDESFDTHALPSSTTVVEVKNHILEVKGYDLDRQVNRLDENKFNFLQKKF